MIVSLTHIVGDPLIGAPIVMALFLEAWIRKQGFASAIHICPSKLSDWGMYCPAFA